MSVITAIMPDKRNKDRVKLYLDGEYFGSVSALVAATKRLEEGREIDEKALSDLLFESDKRNAFDYALGYISRYVCTCKKIEEKLYEKGYGKVVVNFTIEKLASYGYINDAEYAVQYVTVNRGVKGARRLREELKQRGVAIEHIENALKEVTTEEDDAYALAVKHASGKDLGDEKYVARLVRYLSYRGYGQDVIARCLSRLRDECGQKE